MDNVKKIIFQVVLPLSIIFGAELLYRDSLFQASLTDIPLMQAKTKLRPLMENVSLVGGTSATFIVLMVASNLMSKPAGLYLVSGVLFVQYLIDVLKSFYQQQRPFWVSEEINSS